MIRCDNCGTDNLDGSEYCDECGMKLDFAPPPGRGIEVPAYQPPGGAGRVAGRNGDVSQGRLEEAPRGGDVPVPAPPAFTTSTSIPKPARPVRDARRPQASQPPPQPQAAGQSVQSIQGGQETVVPGQTLALSSRGRTDSLRSEPPYAAGVPKVTTRLVIERGGRIGREFPISSVETHIGRWDADSGIFPDVDLDQDDPEAKVSRRHARIVNQSGQYFIEDLGSTNGTFVNRGRRLLPGHRQMLQNGDEIIVGKTFLKFYY